MMKTIFLPLCMALTFTGSVTAQITDSLEHDFLNPRQEHKPIIPSGLFGPVEIRVEK